MTTLAQLQIELEAYRDEKAALMREYDKVNGRYRSGVIATLIGLVLVWFWIGIPIVIIGLLAAVTNYIRRAALNKQIQDLEWQMRHTREKMKKAA